MLIKNNYFIKEEREHSLNKICSSIIIKKNLPQFDINSSALIITDMQNYFLNENSHAFVPSGLEIIENINKLIQIFEKTNRPVIFTQHINNENNADLMGVWWKELILVDNPLSEITDLLNKDKAIFLQKTQYDAFYNTSLNELLNKHNVKQVVITGVMTHLCCETTARSAFIRGKLPFIPIDATATYNLELHSASIQNLSHGFCVPVLTKEFEKKYDK
ncbi:MAG: isochorismatase family cysteine hydrolase [bacterium]